MTWRIAHFNDDDDDLAGEVVLDPEYDDRFIQIVGRSDRELFYEGIWS